MPFTNSPSYSTYKTVPIPFNGEDALRSGDLSNPRDLQIINGYYDIQGTGNDKKIQALKKRPGITNIATNLQKTTATVDIRGSHYDAVQNAMYWVVANKVWKVKQDTSTTPTLVATLNTSSGYVGFTGFLKSTNTRYVCFSDGTDLWVEDYAAVSCTRVTDVDFPTPHQPYPIYLDGYILLVDASSGDLYNSDADDPFAWTAGNFITAEINSDYSIRPVKARNYVALLGYRGVEYFYDAANPTGSPLSRNDSPFRTVGYVTGLATIGDNTYFVGQEGSQNLGVYMLTGFEIKKISNSVVDSTLQTFSSTVNTKGQINLNKDGLSISVDGHNFYVLVTTQTTWAYDIDQKMWYEWRNTSGDPLDIEAAWSMYNGSQYVALADQDYMSVMSPSIYQDLGSNFTFSYTTDWWQAETLNWKTCDRLFLMCDQYTYTVTSSVSVTWSDTDWSSTSSPSARSINVFSQTPDIRRLGRFRSRSWRFEYADNYPLRIQAAMAALNIGTY